MPGDEGPSGPPERNDEGPSGPPERNTSLDRRFAALVARPDGQIPLDETSLVIAAHAQPGLDVDTELEVVDAIAAEVRDPTLTGVLRLLYRDMGFRGDTDTYYDPRNSFLNEVIRRRTGIPITLSILTMEVARRHQVPLAGVGMPGHFLVRDKVDPSVFVDAFDAGRLLDVAGCARLFRRVHGVTAQLDPSYLEPVPRAAIVARVLGNLRAIYGQRGDRRSLAWVLRLRTLLPGSVPGDQAELAETLRVLGDVRGAAEALEQAAHALDASGADGSAPRSAAAQLRARLN
jgi:regulator of sirC expression with transglutaminase-like and TPR domain